MDNSFVTYRREDYAGILRRLASNVIDLAAIGMLALDVVFTVALFKLPVWLDWLWLPLTYLYLIWMKRTVGTLGYLATGIRIVDLKGQPVGVGVLTFRTAWWIFGPIIVLIDLIYLGGDENRQAIRDKLMQTYVIKRRAQPAGHGERRTVYLTFMCFSLLLLEVPRTPNLPAKAVGSTLGASNREGCNPAGSRPAIDLRSGSISRRAGSVAKTAGASLIPEATSPLHSSRPLTRILSLD
jgi:uncharacterized RDD family membrane protein YckC